ncbi:hypothetical protein RZO50_14340 [Microbacterium sp. SSW1-59]|uniref:hypothetical protein n=1 Tax=Microbacterium xanthum TaxID=3079794 RepID=UPI002AD2A496|nr:hypothetical protein [Microbacterium sp. SSW1-59]MDZ8202697.1 hypothetical protein [Microbacterium sp. SSW1-59]
MLWKETPSDLRDGSDPRAVEVLVVAWYLNSLAKADGLSDAFVTPLSARITVPTDVDPFLKHYFTDLDDKEGLRNTLYAALVEVTAEPADRETTEMLLGIAQVYWALSYDKDDRPGLPMKGGRDIAPKKPGGIRQRAWIGTDELDGDFAREKRQDERALLAKGMFKGSDRVLFTTSGSGLRRRGASIAVRIARHIVRTTPYNPPPLGYAQVHPVGNKHEIRVASAVAPVKSSSTPPPTLPPRQANELQALVDRMTFLAEARPHENEDARAVALLLAGFQSARTGRREQAMAEFAKSASISETLSALHPDDHDHDVLLVTALLMDASVRLMTGTEAGEILRRAASLAVDLSDRNDDHADLAATALTLQGVLDMQLADFENARTRMRRAVTISTKISRRPDSDSSSEGLLVSSLVGLAGVELHAGLADEARASITQALTISGRAHEAEQDNFSLAVVHGGVLITASEMLDQLDEPEEGLAAAASAAGIAQCLEANDHSRFALGVSQVAAARCCLSLDRFVEAIEWLSGAMLQFEQLAGAPAGSPLDVTSVHAGALLTRGGLLEQLGRTGEAEASFLRVSGVLDDRTELKDRLILSQSLTMLADLYRATDREPLAAYAAQRADEVMRESLGLPLATGSLEE